MFCGGAIDGGFQRTVGGLGFGRASLSRSSKEGSGGQLDCGYAELGDMGVLVPVGMLATPVDRDSIPGTTFPSIRAASALSHNGTSLGISSPSLFGLARRRSMTSLTRYMATTNSPFVKEPERSASARSQICASTVVGSCDRERICRP